MELNDDAGVISLESLMGDTIGEPKNQEENKVEAEKELQKSLEGKTKDDFFDLGLNEEEVEDDKKDPENKKEEVIEKPEDKKTEEDKKDQPIESSTSIIYKDALKSIFGDLGTIVQENESGEEEEIDLNDIEVDLETFKDLALSKIAEIEEKSNKNKISAEGVSEFTKALIEVDKNGGDVKKLLQFKESYSDPLAALDMDTEDGQSEAIYLRLKASGRTDKEIEYSIKGYKADGILGETAATAKEELEAAISNKVESEKQIALESAKAMEEQLKSYRKNLKENLSIFELKDAIKVKLVDFATKKNDAGQYELDNLYREHRLDPKRVAELALFLADKDEYIKQVTKKEVTEQKLLGAKKLKIIKRTDSSTPDLLNKRKDKDVILFDDLK